jgi:hypothetical protein
VLLLAGRVAEADFRAGDGYARKEVRSDIDNEFRDTYTFNLLNSKFIFVKS